MTVKTPANKKSKKGNGNHNRQHGRRLNRKGVKQKANTKMRNKDKDDVAKNDNVISTAGFASEAVKSKREIKSTTGRRVAFDPQLVKGDTKGRAKAALWNSTASDAGTGCDTEPSNDTIRPILKRPASEPPDQADQINKQATHSLVNPVANKKARFGRTVQLSGKEKAERSNARKGERARALISRKELRERRRKLKIQKRPHYTLIIKAKKLWETVRNRKADDATKSELIAELHSLVAGKAKEMIYAHDGVRVIQCLMAVKDEDIRTKLFEELKDDIVLMTKSKYARFFVTKMLKYGTTAQRIFVIEALAEQVSTLTKHSFAANVVEYAYNNYANALLRTRLCAGFYGNKINQFKPESPSTLADTLSQSSPSEADTIMSGLKDHILQLSTKPSLRHSFIHHIILEFFLQDPKSYRDDVIDALKERVVEIVHTRDGSRAAMYCIWFGSARQRKAIINSMKTLVAKIATEEFGYLVLLSIFDVVDDTTLVGSRIIKELKHNMKQVVESKYGIRVLQYLLRPRNPAHFLPDVSKLLSGGDGNPVSKKPMEKRRAELLEAVSEPLIDYISTNLRDMIFEPLSALLVLECVQYAVEDCDGIFDAIAEVAADDFIPCNEESYHIVEQPRSHFVLSKLLKLDRERVKDGKATLSESLCQRLESAHLKSWTSCNKGCFILIGMLESGIQTVEEKVTMSVKPAVKRLRSYSFAGARILLKKLSVVDDGS